MWFDLDFLLSEFIVHQRAGPLLELVRNNWTSSGILHGTNYRSFHSFNFALSKFFYDFQNLFLCF